MHCNLLANITTDSENNILPKSELGINRDWSFNGTPTQNFPIKTVPSKNRT